MTTQVGDVLSAAGDASAIGAGAGDELVEMAGNAHTMGVAASGAAAVATKAATSSSANKKQAPAAQQPRVAKPPPAPATTASPRPKRGMFGSMFGGSSKAAAGADAARVLELEQRVALLEEQVQMLLQAAEPRKLV